MTIAMVFSPVAGAAGAAVAAGPATADAGAATNSTAGGNATNLGVSVRAELATSDDGDRIPVIVVLESQPDNRFGDDTSTERMQSFAQDQQAGVRDAVAAATERGAAGDVRSFWVRNAIAVNATPGVVRDLAARSDVKRVVYDQPVHSLGSGPSGPLDGLLDELAEEGTLANAPSTQGFERTTSGDRAWGVEYIGADAVQDRGVDGSGVNVSVVDTGIDDEHPALRGRVIEWQDFVANNTEPVDPDGHGTHVAGTIAGQPGREHAVGVAPDTNLFGARALDANGAGDMSDIMAAFEWSVNQSADVVSASLGIPPKAVETTGESELNSSETLSRNVSVPANISATGYQPASVFVRVAPGDNVANRSAAMANLSVSFSGPNGEALQRNRADWLYQAGVFPNTTGLWKYKPASGPVPGGNWSLEVTNAGGSVPVEYDAIAIYPSNGSDELSAFVDDLANTTNVTPVVAAGNGGFELGNRSIGSPGAAASAITVGASAEGTNDVAGLSSRGPVGFDDAKRAGIDVIAPGMNVLSTIPTNQTADGVPAYGTKSGTSMATPHVAGVAALMLDAANGSLNRTQLTDRLKSTAQPAPDAPNAVGAGVVDAWAAVNATTTLSATANGSLARHELYGGLAGEQGNYDDVLIPAFEDGQDASGGAPDIWVVERDVGEKLAVRTYNDAPNATFTLFADTDRDDSTGAQRGSDVKIVVERRNESGDLNTTTTVYAYSTTNTTFERVEDRYAGVEMVRENYLSVWTDDALPTSFEWHLVAETPDGTGSDAFPAQGTGQKAVPSIVNVSVPAQAVAWDTGPGVPDAGTNLTFTLSGPDGESLDQRVAKTGANGTANATLTLPYNTSKDWRLENFEVSIADEYGNSVAEEIEAYPKEAAIHYGDPIYQDDGLQVEDRDYRADPDETLTVNIPIHYETPDGVVPYNGTADLIVDGLGEGVTYSDVSVERGVLTQQVDLSMLQDGTTDANIEVRPPDQGYDDWAGDIRIGTEADASFAPPAHTVSPGGTANFSVQLTRSEDGATRPLNGTAAYEALWLTDIQVYSLASNLSGSLGADLKRLATGDSVTLDAGERERVRNAVESTAVAPDERTGQLPTDARGRADLSVTAPDDTVFGIVRARAANVSSASATGIVTVEDRLSGYFDRRTEPAESPENDLYVSGEWVTPTNASSHYEVDVTYRPADYSAPRNVTVSLYATTGATKNVTLNSEGRATVNVSAPTVGPDDPAGMTDQGVLGVVQNLSNPDGRAISDTYDWISAPFERPETPPHRVEAESTVTFDDDTLRVNLSYVNETGAPADPTWTLLRVASPSTYGTTSDVAVTYVNPQNRTPSYTFDAPTDPTTPREFEAEARTGIPPSWYFGGGGYARADGLTVQSSVPNPMVAGNTTYVSVSATDRNGDPVPNATVVWDYQAFSAVNASEHTQFPRPRKGGYEVGTTGADGTATIPVHLDADLAGEPVRTRARVTTDNVSVVGNEGFTRPTLSDKPDLRSDLNVPDTVAPDENIPVSATFTNGGSVTATNATYVLRFYNETARAMEELNGVNRTLEPGESFTLSGTVTENLSEYEIRAFADFNETVDELDESNNGDVKFVEVVTPKPDLVAEIDAPDAVDQDENVSVNATFTNAGNENATDATFDVQSYNVSSDSWETFAEVSGALDAGESLTLNGTVIHDQSAYELRARADVGNNASESNEDNNIDLAFVEVNQPDLVAALDAPDAVQQGENVSVNATFTNAGTANAMGASFVLQFHNQSSDSWETFAEVSEALDAGESLTLNGTITHNQGSYEVRAVADFGENVPDESNEDNNLAYATVDVAGPAPDLVTTLDAPDTVPAGEDVTATATFENVGDATAENVTAGIGLRTDDGPLKTLNRTLEPGELATLSVTVNRDVTEYPFVAAAVLNGTDDDPTPDNNFALHNVTVTGLSNDAVEFGFEPANETADAGETLTMNVTADTGNASLYGATTVVDYDTDLLSVTAIEAGGFLASDGANTTVVAPEIDDANGTAEISVTRLNDTEAGSSGISGNGTLATLTVEVAADAPAGASAALSIGQETQLSDADKNPIPYVGNHTTITVETVDVSVGASMYDTVLNVGSAAPVAVTASAPGATLDRVDVVGPFGERNETSPDSDSFDDSLTVTPSTSTWNGESYNEVNVTAEASVGETVARDDVSVTVHIAGDATGDGTVNIFDAVSVGTAWDTTAGDARYGGAPDLNSDGEVSVEDAALLGQNWKNSTEVFLR